MPSIVESVDLGHERVGSLARIDRSKPLPDICVVTGEKATCSVKILFHWKTNTFGASDPVEAVIMGLFFYFFDVPKAVLRIPISSKIALRRTVGWTFAALIVFVTLATIATLLIGQGWIDQLPKGETKSLLTDFGIPGVAIGGLALILSMFWFIHLKMPMLTVILKVVEISATHVTLEHAHENFLRSLERASEKTALSPAENQ